MGVINDKPDKGTVCRFDDKDIRKPDAGIGLGYLTDKRSTFHHLELEKAVVGIGEQKTVIVILSGRSVSPNKMHREGKALLGQFASEAQTLRPIDGIGFAINELESVPRKPEDIGRQRKVHLPGRRLEQCIEPYSRFIELLG